MNASPVTPSPERPALAGIRALELAGVDGQYCGKLLADMGADVIKIEPPAGDPARRVGPFAEDRPSLDRSLPFWYFNSNKRAVTLDWSKAEGRKLLLALLPTTDIVLESSPPGSLHATGLGYEKLAQVQPRLILTSITPFGQTGPWRDLRACDLVSLALAGTLAMNGYDDRPGSPPIRPDGGHAALMAGEYAFLATLLALLERASSEHGQWLDVSIHEACACTTEGAFANWEYFQRVVRRQTARHAQAANPTQPWQHRAVDGRYVNLLGGGIPRMSASWRPLVAWLDRNGKAEDLADERYEAVVHRSPAQRADTDSLHVLNVLARFAGSLTAEEIYRGGQTRRLPWAIVRSPEENLVDPHWRDRGFFVEAGHPERPQPVEAPGAPYRFSRTPWRLRRRAPRLGEHNVEIYQGELGLGREELRELFEQGII